jgi:hypothetical protein
MTLAQVMALDDDEARGPGRRRATLADLQELVAMSPGVDDA